MRLSSSPRAPAATRRPARGKPDAFSGGFDHQNFLADCGCFSLTLDGSGHILEADRQAEQITGYARREILKKTLAGLVAPEYRHFITSLLKPETTVDAAWVEKLPLLCKDSSRTWVRLAARAVRQAGHPLRVRVLGMPLGVPELSARLLQVQDQERRRIARELHDTTGQILTALQIRLARVEQSAEELDEEARQALSESIAMARACVTDVRTLSYLLHPPLLDELGLISALRHYAEGYAQRTGVRLELDLPDRMDRLPLDAETALFRIVQEGLTNIHRHSGSPTAVLRLKAGRRWVKLELTDHGRGIRAEVLQGSEAYPGRVGVGIAGMRERARQLGGRLSIRSAPGGTILRVELSARSPGEHEKKRFQVTRRSARSPAGMHGQNMAPGNGVT